MAQIVKFGYDSVSFLKKILSQKLPKNILLVTGKISFTSSNAEKEIEPILNDFCHVRFYDFDRNPKVEDVERGISLFNKNNCDLIIAVGGGSVIDMAKLINIFHSEHGNLRPLIVSNTTNGSVVPFIALPTTSGTGSEATHFAVAYVDKKKYSVSSNKLLPETVLINPAFAFSASKYLTAVTGLDAFAQAIESYWSVNSNKESIEYSTKAIKILWDNLPLAVNKNDEKAKEKISWASHLAGKAINIAKTTAPHAVSYSFTSHYKIPHGHAVALTLAHFLEFNYNVTDNDCNDKRGASFVKKNIEDMCALINIKTKNLESTLTEFILSLGIETSIKKLIGNNFDAKIILDNINAERMKNNPRKVLLEFIYNILK